MHVNYQNTNQALVVLRMATPHVQLIGLITPIATLGVGECSPPLPVSCLCILQTLVHVCANKLARTFLHVYLLLLSCGRDIMRFSLAVPG